MLNVDSRTVSKYLPNFLAMVNRCSKELIEPGGQQEWCDFMWIAGLQEFAAVALRPSARGSPHVGLSGGRTLPRSQL